MITVRFGARLFTVGCSGGGRGSSAGDIRRVLARSRSAMSSRDHRTAAGAMARDIFAAAVEAVRTDRLVKRVLQVPSPGRLLVNGRQYDLQHNVSIVAFGKAVLGMVRAAEDALGQHVVRGVASVPAGLRDQLMACGNDWLLPRPDSAVKVIEGARNNVPDLAAQGAADEILQLLRNVGKDDLVLTLVSGGGSALLPLPVPPVLLTDVLDITVALSRAGATITELNTVRKHLELLKGGGLASVAYPAKVISLVLSDIVGDPLDFIASGPTVPDLSTSLQALAIISRYLDPVKVSPRVLDLLRSDGKSAALRGLGDGKRERPAPGEKSAAAAADVHNVLVGTNADALEAARGRCLEIGLQCAVLTRTLQGEARLAGEQFAWLGELARFELGGRATPPPPPRQLAEGSSHDAWRAADSGQVVAAAARAARSGGARGLCLLAGGETTVTVRGRGRGGRNQEMALAAAAELARLRAVARQEAPPGGSGEGCIGEGGGQLAFLSAGTDGQDGPTDVAGACVDSSVADATLSGKDCRSYLDDNDSYNFFSGLNGGGNFVRTGLTGTNVMDVHVLVVTI